MHERQKQIPHFTEADILTFAHPSTLPWEYVSQVIPFPKVVTNLRILDVGGGAANATAQLVARGADAVSVDPVYADPTLVQRVQKSLRQGVDLAIYTPQHYADRMSSLTEFARSVALMPERYKAASATKLPFPDNQFDLVFSMNAVSVYLTVNREIYLKAVKEALRVTKPGGTFHLFPIREDLSAYTPAVNTLRAKNEESVLNYLAKQQDKYETSIAIFGVDRERLVVTKK